MFGNVWATYGFGIACPSFYNSRFVFQKGCGVSTATATDWALPLIGGQNHFVLRRLHSLTGIMFGGYLVVHLVVNATLAQRGSVYQAQVNKIHDLPWLPAIEWAFIFLPIIYHTLYGLWITVTGQWNNTSYPYAKNWFYLFQRLSAIYLIAFIAFHVLSLKYGVFGRSLGFDPEEAQRTIVRHMHFNPIIAWVVYPLGVLASAYHTGNGFWTAGITWGLTVSEGSQRRWGYVCGVVAVLLFVAGMLSVFAAAMAKP
jgi:succinate dehydrogenase / fumarate reductase cytochrome b subunit